MYVPSRAFLGAEGTNGRRSWNSWYRSGAQVWFCLFQTVDSTQRSSFLPSQDFCLSYFHQEMVLGGELSEIAYALLDVAQTFIEGGGDCLLLPALCQNLSLLCYCGAMPSCSSKSSHLSCWTLLCCSLCYWLCEIAHFLMKAVVSSVLICQMLLLFLLLAGKSRFVVAARVSGLALVSGMTSPGVQLSDDMAFHTQSS